MAFEKILEPARTLRRPLKFDSIPCHCGYFREPAWRKASHRPCLRPSAMRRARRFLCKGNFGCRSNRTLPNGESRTPNRVRNWVPSGRHPCTSGSPPVTTAVRRVRRLRHQTVIISCTRPFFDALILHLSENIGAIACGLAIGRRGGIDQMATLDEIGQEKQRISERLARIDAERTKLADQLNELEITERVLTRFGGSADTAERRRRGRPARTAAAGRPAGSAERAAASRRRRACP